MLIEVTTSLRMASSCQATQRARTRSPTPKVGASTIACKVSGAPFLPGGRPLGVFPLGALQPAEKTKSTAAAQAFFQPRTSVCIVLPHVPRQQGGTLGAYM